MAILNTNVNFDDYSHPVKTFIDDGFYWDLVPGIRKRTDIFIQKNYGKFEDGYFMIDNVDSAEFYQILNSNERFNSIDNSKVMLSVYFRRDTTRLEYRRVVYTLVDSLAKIGGFFQLMTAFIKLVLPIFIENLFYARILTKLYQVDADHEQIYLTDSENYECDEDYREVGQHQNPSLQAEGGEPNLNRSKKSFLHILRQILICV